MTPIVYAAVAAWALAQLLKIAVAFARIGRGEKARIVWRFVWAGGMPSAHSAFVTAAFLTAAWAEGLASPAFGLSFVLTAVVIHDRIKLHHIYLVFQERFPSVAAAAESDPVMKDLVGHTVAEVTVGGALGIVAAGLTFLMWPG